MRGQSVSKKTATGNYVQRIQFIDGIGTFQQISILDVHPGIRLNLTVFQSHFPWIRRPDSYTDFASKVVYPYGGPSGDTVYFMNTSYPQDPAVFLTPRIEVTGKRFFLLNKNPYQYLYKNIFCGYMGESFPA